MRNLALAIQNIDRYENDSGFNTGEIKVDHLDAIGQIYAQSVAGFETFGNQILRQTIAA